MFFFLPDFRVPTDRHRGRGLRDTPGGASRQSPRARGVERSADGGAHVLRRDESGRVTNRHDGRARRAFRVRDRPRSPQRGGGRVGLRRAKMRGGDGADDPKRASVGVFRERSRRRRRRATGAGVREHHRTRHRDGGARHRARVHRAHARVRHRPRAGGGSGEGERRAERATETRHLARRGGGAVLVRRAGERARPGERVSRHDRRA